MNAQTVPLITQRGKFEMSGQQQTLRQLLTQVDTPRGLLIVAGIEASVYFQP
jgi:hypothetical protein